jgi:hypothetical protein
MRSLVTNMGSDSIIIQTSKSKKVCLIAGASTEVEGLVCVWCGTSERVRYSVEPVGGEDT